MALWRGLAVAAGYDVVLSNSRGPQTLRDLVEELGRMPAAAPAEGDPGRDHERLDGKG